MPGPTLNATQLVNSGWEYLRGEAGDLMLNAQLSLYNLSNAINSVSAPVITYSAPVIETGTFIRPTAPTAPTISGVSVTLPDTPSLTDVTLDALTDAPTAPDFSGLVFSKPAAPTAAMPTRPADTDVSLVEIVVPDAPAYVIPGDPTLYTITIPDIPDLAIPTFSGTRPTLTLEAPTEGLNWAFTAYDQSTIETVKATLLQMVTSGQALPADVEQAIFDRARGREDALSLSAKQQAASALASSGLRQPAGMLQRTSERLEAQTRAASAGGSRDLSIEIARMNVQAVQFGLSQLGTLEVALMQDHIAAQGLMLEGAKAAIGATIDIFNANVALHNAQWEGFKAEANVFESQIRALQAEADVMKTRIEGQKVIGDLNESLVRAYGEKVRSLSALADMHRAQVEAAKAQGEINVQRLEQVRLRLQAYQIDVDAWDKGWSGFEKQVNAEATGLRFHEAKANVYGQQVNAWRSLVEAQGTRANTQIAANGQRLDLFRAQLAGVATDVQAQSANVEAVARLFATQAALFSAEVQASAAESNAVNDSSRLRLDGSRLEWDTARSNAEIAANFALKRGDLALEGHRGAAQIWSQLASALLSGMNFGASMSYGESLGISYSGEI